MAVKQASSRKIWRRSLRLVLSKLPRSLRFSLYRQLIDCDPAPDSRLQLKVANTKDELEACFRLLHDAYVASGFMKPSPSGLRVTPYHALPTTTTLCAKYDNRVVGTISMIREGVFGFPMQSVFDLGPLRVEEGQVAEISALAVHPDFRKTGGSILFPLMKFMYEYCTQYFDTRHLVIAVNPDRIEMYESLLFFRRLTENTVDRYDFANGAPAVGATLDLYRARDVFRRVYGGRPARKNLFKYFTESLPNIQLPRRRYHLTNDPVLTPELIDYFFNQRSQVFAELDDRRRALLWSIYDQPEYRSVLPLLRDGQVSFDTMRRHQRFSMRCPAEFKPDDGSGRTLVVTVIQLSLSGFQAHSKLPLPVGVMGRVIVELGKEEQSRLEVTVVRKLANDGDFYGVRVVEADDAWRRCVAALETHHVSAEF